jgi:hypothetical protein
VGPDHAIVPIQDKLHKWLFSQREQGIVSFFFGGGFTSTTSHASESSLITFAFIPPIGRTLISILSGEMITAMSNHSCGANSCEPSSMGQWETCCRLSGRGCHRKSARASHTPGGGNRPYTC